MKETVRLSFDVPVEEHTMFKTESVQSRTSMKQFLHELLLLGLKEYQEKKFNDALKASIQQAESGQVVSVTMSDLNEWEKLLDNDAP